MSLDKPARLSSPARLSTASILQVLPQIYLLDETLLVPGAAAMPPQQRAQRAGRGAPWKGL